MAVRDVDAWNAGQPDLHRTGRGDGRGVAAGAGVILKPNRSEFDGARHW
jgi:hypothetical protein